MAEQDKDGKLKPGPYAQSNGDKTTVDHVDVNNKIIDNRKPIKTTTQRLKRLR